MIYTLVLAAGSSTRLGGHPKALLTTTTGKTFVQQIAETAKAAGSGGVFVVIGAPHADQVKKRLPPGVGTCTNPRPDRGMLSSIETGLQTLPQNASGVLVWPVDHPMVSVETVRAILNAAPSKIIIPMHGGKGGHPVRIPRSKFGEIGRLDAEIGLRHLFELAPDSVHRLEVNDANIHVDVDTRTDYDKLRSAHLPGAAAAPAAAATEESPAKKPKK